MRRLWKHLTRERALFGWVGIASLALADNFLDSKSLHEFVLVLVAVVLSFIFMPENVPLSKQGLEKAAREVLGALSPDRGPDAWRFGCRPILEADPMSIREEFRYQVLLTRALLADGEGADHEVYAVETDNLSRRTLEASGLFWVSFALDLKALWPEYRERACLNRELVTVPLWLWNRMIAERDLLDASFTIEGVPCELMEVRPVGGRLVHFFFDTSVAASAPLNVRIHTRFLLPAVTTAFPVTMANYFCKGTSEFTFVITDREVQAVDAFPSFSGPPDFDPVESSYATLGTLQADQTYGFRVETKSDALLLPGSGVVFAWEQRA